MAVKQFIKNLSYFGIYSDTESDSFRNITLTNKVAMTFCLVAFPYFFIFHWLKLPILGNGILVLEFLMGSCVFLNKSKKYKLSRLLLMTTYNSAVFFYAYQTGVDSGIQLVYFATICLPAFLFKPKEKFSILFGLAQPILGMLILHLVLYQSTSQTVPISKIIYWLMLPTVFIFIGTTVFYFYYENVFSEKKLTAYNSLLETANADLKTAQAKLVQSAKMSALGEMAGGVAHEINTPLAIISVRVEQMEEALKEQSSNNQELIEFLEIMKKTSDRIARIVSGLKYFAKESASDPAYKVSVAQILEQTLNLCQERFIHQGITLKMADLESCKNIEIECRPLEISQVLLNLLNNSYDAVEPLKEKWVQVKVEDLGNDVEISVSDSGPGIAKDIQDKIMQPFFTTKEIGKGTGLGLSVSKGIVDQHGGKLFLDSATSSAKFVLQLPKESWK